MTTSAIHLHRSSELLRSLQQEIANHRGWYIFQGFVFIVAGVLALLMPGITALGAALSIGALLIVSGAAQALGSLRAGMHWWAILSAGLSLILGALMLVAPVSGTIALATLIAVFLLAEGAVEILLSLQYRPARQWKWLLASGLVTLALAMLVFSGWPALTVAFLGITIGINLVFYGSALLALSAPETSYR